MKKRICVTFLAAVLLLVFASPLSAGKKRPHPSKLKYPSLKITTPESTDLAFDNGLEGFLIEDHEIPVVDVVLLLRTYFPEEEKYGLNEMNRWVIRNGGTEAWPSDKLNDELEFLAASIEVVGGDLSTNFYVNCLKKDLPRVLEILADLVMNPAYPEDKVEMKRKTMLEEIRRQNDEPSRVYRREFFRLMYAGHPFGWRASMASVNAITREDLAACHKKYFYPNNSIIGVSGDVTKAEIIGALDKVFGGWQPAEVTIPEVPPFEKKDSENYNYAYMDINQAYMMIGHSGIKVQNPDRCAINIMNFILGGGSFTSWITERVRSEEGLAYSTGSRYGSNAWAKGVFYAYAQTKSDAYSRALQLIIDQIEKMINEGPTEEEVSKAIDSYVNSQVFDYESKSQVVRRLVFLTFEGRPLDSPERDMEKYAAITVDDIRRVSKKYLHPEMLTVLVVGDEAQFDRPLSDFGSVNVIELKEE
ncbi:MAG: insulinase family protein [bacterium]|nr:MAG: insulinase family protein [bacterium]